MFIAARLYQASLTMGGGLGAAGEHTLNKMNWE